MVSVSVIIPAYNQAQYLGAAIQSVLDQTYRDFEVVVVDDGSADNTEEVARAFNDPRVRYLHQDNRGLSAARNTGIRNSDSEFVSFLDSDDLLLPCNLSSLSAYIGDKPHIGFVAGKALLVDSEGRTVGTIEGRMPCRPEHLLFGDPCAVGTMLVRRDWLQRVGLFDETLRACEDWDLWLRMALAGCAMASVDVTVFCYRTHGFQMTREPDRMRTAMLATLDKVYSSDRVPLAWQALREKAYASALAKAAAREYRAGMTSAAQLELAEAVTRDHELLGEDGDMLACYFMGWAFDAATPDPARYIETVFSNLPENLRSLASQRRRRVSDVYAKLAFDRLGAGDLPGSLDFARRAVVLEPRWLANRGFLSILLRGSVQKTVGRGARANAVCGELVPAQHSDLPVRLGR